MLKSTIQLRLGFWVIVSYLIFFSKCLQEKKKSNLQKAGKKEKNKAQTQLRKYFYVVSMMTCLGFEELMSLKWSLAQ